MSENRRRYSKAKKLEMVELNLDEDVHVTDRYGIPPNTIYNWRSRYYKEQGIEPTRQGVKQMTKSEREIARLKKQLQEAKLERDILKKAINIFSRGDEGFS